MSKNTNELVWNVFPAHAGMSLRSTAASNLLIGFPRSRGDEPPMCPDPIAFCVFSPLTRG